MGTAAIDSQFIHAMETPRRREAAWIEAMRRGAFQRAWTLNHRDLQARIARGEPKHVGARHLQHIWRGEPLNDARVLVRCYHGLGDTLQFIRFAAPLRRIAREVILWVQPELIELTADARGVDRALPLHDGTPEVDYDADIEIMELAFALRVSHTQIEASVPYLWPPQGAAPRLEPGRFHVGLVWRAGDWDPRRSVALRRFSALALPNVRLHLLQPAENDEAAGWSDCLWRPRIRDAAGTIARLDAVITVDTMMAHLAGAMGLPVWTLLCRDCDWRWGVGETTPWYRSMRLFRQTRAGDWQSVIERVAESLARIVRERTKERHSESEVWK
jgi:hypothetical protein